MRLTVLVDNNTFIDQYLLGEPAVSFFIETEGRKILFDAGYSDIFLQNAQKLGIDLTTVDTVVLSHGHQDHTWGLKYLVRLFSKARANGKMTAIPKLIAHPQVFAQRSYKDDPHVGSLMQEVDLRDYFDIQLSQAPVSITERLIFLGEIDRKNDFESRQNVGVITLDGRKNPDFVLDDSALVYLADEGLVIITGCSHAGICNIIDQARRFSGESRVVDIIGGFHLLEPSVKQMHETLDYLKALQPAKVHACHCTGLQAKMDISQVVNLYEVGSGLTLDF